MHINNESDLAYCRLSCPQLKPLRAAQSARCMVNCANGQSGFMEAHPRPGDGVGHEEDSPHNMH